jgi:hypothetical protein
VSTIFSTTEDTTMSSERDNHEKPAATHGDPTPPAIRPSRREALAAMAFGLVGLPTASIRDPAKAAEATRLIAAWRRLKEDNEDDFVIEGAESAAGVGLGKFFGLDTQAQQLFAIEYAGRLLVVELDGYPIAPNSRGISEYDPNGRPGAQITEVDLRMIGKL